MNHPRHLVTVDILKSMLLLSNMQTLKLQQHDKCEIIRQVFHLFDKKPNLNDFYPASTNFINTHMLTCGPLNNQQLSELNAVCFEIAMSTFFEVAEIGLMNNYHPDKGFPFFLEHINSNSAFLLLEPEVSPIPY